MVNDKGKDKKCDNLSISWIKFIQISRITFLYAMQSWKKNVLIFLPNHSTLNNNIY